MIDNHDLDEAIEQLDSILDMARWAVSRFIEADLYFGHGTDNPWDEAVTLIFHSLQLPQNMVEVTGDGLFSAKLTKQEKKVVVESIQKRVQTRLPLPYITNQAWFNGMPFYVDERVLIPRSPFAEMIESRFQPYFDGMPNRILDMCTGGGCIAIALAHAFESASIDAVDISADALEVADFNIQEYQMSDRVFPIQSDLFDALQGQIYDLIVTNPPYVDAEDMADLPDEFQHEPELALASGEDGLDIVEQILKSATQQLSDNGWCFVEVGNSQVHMEQRFPGLAVEWVELQQGGQGIFAVSAAALKQYFIA
ncbi:50S ribosomal protein L3 N(5)-glutamine methyltransferase [Alteromonas sp. 5E99-2]|uniref:50S ribosomal protein L3 N(5)-glutamine methyltransferase n=1 Tax=Alteromonas sp. 5E99-2 TaxID=2817683 RepID=UPI001A9862EE|nr:50S ribosomal protein L3 N(5)-glutamine methyltransferase [Alteromonas sp. 5E99-2]MBO1255996.1 50S ribosomal protein L3 N(5)-glutamine methyltransferase [Alteromonas sp. 5E99-2]